MKIRVVPEIWFRVHGWGGDPLPVYRRPDSPFWKENNFISIRNSFTEDPRCAIPVDGENILRLQFDDATADPECSLTLFDESMAERIASFVKTFDSRKLLFVNCSAGVSRSGAVGEVLDEYFNVYLEKNPLDHEYFLRLNPQIQGNSLVRRLLRRALIGIC